MRHRLRALWPVAKRVLGLAILGAIAWRFRDDFRRPELWQRSIQPVPVVLSGVLYLLGLGFSALYWQRLLHGLGVRPATLVTLRAYYLGHLGKYLPGKAWALFLRADLARPGGVPLTLSILTGLYEVLTTMASGALLALVLFAWLAPSSGTALDWDLTDLPRRLREMRGGILDKSAILPLALILVGATGLPLLPGIFNRLARRIEPPDENATELPRLRFTWLLEGFVLTMCGWVLLAVSLVAVLHAILGGQLQWAPVSFLRLVASLAFAYVAGFLVLPLPSGIGVREFFLTLLLIPELEQMTALSPEAAREVAVLAVIVLRLVWTAAELVMAATLYALLVQERRLQSRRANDPRSLPGGSS